MVGRGDRPLGVAHGQAATAKTREGLRAGDLVDEVEVDTQHGRGARLVEDDVLVPDLVDQGARRDRLDCHGRSVANEPRRPPGSCLGSPGGFGPALRHGGACRYGVVLGFFFLGGRFGVLSPMWHLLA
jgi:hypothetical protein